MSRQGKEEYAKAILKTGTQRMPNFNFSTEEIGSVIEYLKYINQNPLDNPFSMYL